MKFLAFTTLEEFFGIRIAINLMKEEMYFIYYISNKVGVVIYALNYDEFDPAKREKKVISVHKTRETAEKALKKRQRKLGRRVWECYTRIVWVHGRVHEGEKITPNFFDTWAPGEKIPEGDRVPDGD